MEESVVLKLYQQRVCNPKDAEKKRMRRYAEPERNKDNTKCQHIHAGVPGKHISDERLV